MLLLAEAGYLPSTIAADDERVVPHASVREHANRDAQPMEPNLCEERGEASCPTAPPSPPSTPPAPHQHLAPRQAQAWRWVTILVAVCASAMTAGLLLRCTYRAPAFSRDGKEPKQAEITPLTFNSSRGSMPLRQDQPFSIGERDCPAEWTPLRLRQDGPIRCFRVLQTLKSHYDCAAALCSAVDLNGTRLDGTLAMPASAAEAQLLQAKLLDGELSGPASDMYTDSLHAAHRDRMRAHASCAHASRGPYAGGSAASAHPPPCIRSSLCR